MKTLALTLSAAALAATGAMAQDAGGVQDENEDGIYSMEELTAAYPELTEEQYDAIDADGDESVDVGEFADAVEAGLLPS